MKRSALKRTRFQASGRALSRKAQEYKLDNLCRAVVFDRDDYFCVKCRKSCILITDKPDGTKSYNGIQWAHVHSRGKKSMRWEPDNSMCLCAGCHLWWHHHPTLAGTWFAEKYPERFERLKLLAQTQRGPVDLEAVRLMLEQMLEAGERSPS